MFPPWHLQFYSWVATAYAFWLCWHPYTTCLSDAEHEHYPKELCAEWTTARPRLFYVSLAALTTLSVWRSHGCRARLWSDVAHACLEVTPPWRTHGWCH